MFENVPFFEQMHTKFANSTNTVCPKTFFMKISEWGSKTAKFYADSKLFEMGIK
jgi:hypothetical protein